jgi:hypothetical protein
VTGCSIPFVIAGEMTEGGGATGGGVVFSRIFAFIR